MGTNVEHRRARPLSYTEPETQNDGKTSSEGNFLRGRSPSGQRNRRPCKDDITGKCANPSFDSRHPPVCQNYSTESGCKFDEKCSFVHRVDCQPNTNLKRIVAKVLLPFWRIPGKKVAYARTLSRRNPIRFHGRAQNSWDQSAAWNSQSVLNATWKFGKEKVHRKVWFSTLILMSAALMLQNLRTGLQNRLWNKSDAPAETRGKWQWDTATFFSPSDVWYLPAPSSTKPEERELVVDSGAMLSRERSELSWTGYRQSIQKRNNCFYSQWCSANKSGSNSARQRFGFIRDSTDAPGYARSSIAWETLRRSLIFFWVDQWEKPHLIKNGRIIQCNTENYVPIVVPRLLTGPSSSTMSTPSSSASQDSVGKHMT